MRKQLFGATIVLTIIVGSRSLQAQTTEQPTVKELIEQAEVNRKEADAMGFEWATTATHIKNAQAALEAGKEDEARTLANKALFEAKQSVAQGKKMKQQWQTLIPKP